MARKKAIPAPAATAVAQGFVERLETVPITTLKPHPQNYQAHPDDQVEHLAASIRNHGFYHNIVVARDGTILAGHGVVLAATRLGEQVVPVFRLDLDPEDYRALKVLTGDNEISHLAERDDRMLSELLRTILAADETKLVGTGYDEAMLANLVMMTRAQSEVKDLNEAAQWVGMPEFEQGQDVLRLVINFASEADRAACLTALGLDLPVHARSTWFPPRQHDDSASVRFEG